ncbi:hypothetical protein PFISCL1PPCAC_19171, partial [Pristionchus fissidentatus]
IAGAMSQSDLNSPPTKRPKNDSCFQTSLMDLPDDILSIIFSNLDLNSRFKFRVNQRLNRIELMTKNKIMELELTESDDSWSIVVEELNGLESINITMEMVDLKEGLKRVAMNTSCISTNI